MTDGQLLLLADVILVLHFCIALFLTFGLPVIWLGGLLGWRFVRNARFRYCHAGLMGVVVLESLIGVFCPLTTWEAALRRAAGGSEQQQSFVAYWVGRALYRDYDELYFTITYVAFFLAIVVTFFLVPVDRKRAKREKTS